MVTFLIFIAVLAVLVLSHEFGHFIVARKSGMKVYEFGFGFPPRILGVQWVKNADGKRKMKLIWGKKKIDDNDVAIDLLEIGAEPPAESIASEGTVSSLNLIPLGGFVQIKGENGEEPGPDSFSAQKAWKRALVLCAGVGMNIILGFILLTAGLVIGTPQSVENLPSGVRVADSRIEIIEAMPGTPAAQAGLQAGDIVVGLDGLKNPTVKHMQEYVDSHKDKEIVVAVKRGGEVLEKKIHPFVFPDTGKGGLGVSLIEVGLVSYPWYKAVYYGLLMTGFYLKEILAAFYGLIAGLFAGNNAGANLSGPVGIAVMTGQVARMGWSYLLNFIALLSLNLAIINILPIPALDGGRLLFLVISKIRRKPVTQKYEQLAHTLGFVVLMAMVVIITIKDLGNFKGFFIDLWNKVI